MLDWMLIWTAVMAIAAVLTILFTGFAWIVARSRKADWDKINMLKGDSDQQVRSLSDIMKAQKVDSDIRITSLDNKLTDVYTNMQAKLDKSEHQAALSRIDKEIADLRSDAKAGQAEIRQDIKDLRTDLMNALRARVA